MQEPTKRIELIRACRRLMADMERVRNSLGAINCEAPIALALNLDAAGIPVQLLSRSMTWKHQGGRVALAVSLDGQIIGRGGCGSWKALAHDFYKELDPQGKKVDPILLMKKVEVVDLPTLLSTVEPGIKAIVKRHQNKMKESVDALVLEFSTQEASGPYRSRRM